MKGSRRPHVISMKMFENRDTISQYHSHTETRRRFQNSGLYVWSQQSHMEKDDHLPALLYCHFALQAGV